MLFIFKSWFRERYHVYERIGTWNAFGLAQSKWKWRASFAKQPDAIEWSVRLNWQVPEAEEVLGLAEENIRRGELIRMEVDERMERLGKATRFPYQGRD